MLKTGPATERELLGVLGWRGVVYGFFRQKNLKKELVIEVSGDGQKFGEVETPLTVYDKQGEAVEVKNWIRVQVSRREEEYVLVVEEKKLKQTATWWAKGKELQGMRWQGELGLTKGGILGVNEQALILVNGGKEIEIRAWGKDKGEKQVLIKSEKDFFGELELRAWDYSQTGQNGQLVYTAGRETEQYGFWRLKLAEFKLPGLEVERTIVLWEVPDEWAKKKVRLIGVVRLGAGFVSFWQGAEGVWSVKHPWVLVGVQRGKLPEMELDRHGGNPIIAPLKENLWESRATFNPAALIDEEENVHLLYRAIGEDDTSALGYARSGDGWQIDWRSPVPVYTPEVAMPPINRKAKPANYLSGGGTYGGCEDPRLVHIGERVYMTYVAFNGWDCVRMALTSIEWNDFCNQRWNWTEPVFLSKPGEIHKNWVLFPDKINGKFALLHSISPQLTVHYFNDFAEFDGETFVPSKYVKHQVRGRWDSWVRGAGPPPLKTEAGWVVLYHAMDVKDPNRYKLGAMLLDLKDPERVVCRSRGPILQPDKTYENEGFKAGVIYSCGAVVKDGKLVVYYGGADTVVCAAAIGLDEFVSRLKHHHQVELMPRLLQV